MSKPRVTTGHFIQRGKFKLGEQILDTPELVEFEAVEAATPGRKVTISMLRNFSFGENARSELIRSLRLLQSLRFRNFPSILEIDSTSAAPEQDIWVFCNWKASKQLSKILEEVRKKNARPDPSFALYVLKTMASAVSTLHQCRVSDFETVHGAISPESLWIEADGGIRCHNHILGLARAAERGQSLDTQDDIRSLGTLYWNIVTLREWVNAQEASEVDPDNHLLHILEASGLWNGSGCRSVDEFARVVDQVIAAGPFYATQKYASYWQREAKRQPVRLRTGPIFTPKITKERPSLLVPADVPSLSPPSQQVAAEGPMKSARGDSTKSLVPWIALVLLLLLVGAVSIWFLLSKQQVEPQRVTAPTSEVAPPAGTIQESKPASTVSASTAGSPPVSARTKPTPDGKSGSPNPAGNAQNKQTIPAAEAAQKPPEASDLSIVTLPSINSTPEATVMVYEPDGAVRDLGKVPISEPLTVPVGTRIVFRAEGRADKTAVVKASDNNKPFSTSLPAATTSQ